MTQRWLGSGRAGDADPRIAGAHAAREALGGRPARLLLVFAEGGRDLAAVCEGAQSVAGDDAIIAGALAARPSCVGTGDAPVEVMALGGPGFIVSAARVTATGDIRDAAAQASACIGDVADCDHQLLVLLADPAAGDAQEAVRGAYSVAGAGVPIVGGGATAAGAGSEAVLWHDDEPLSRAVVAAAIGSDAPIGVGIRHGWRAAGEPMLVTRVDGLRILELDGRPALDAYLDRIRAPRSLRDDRAAIHEMARHHPLGLARRAGEPQLRTPTAVDPADRSIALIGEVAPGAMLWTMRGGQRSALAATDRACQEARGALGGLPPAGLVAFSCPDRCAVLGADGIAEAAERVGRHAEGAPVAGFSACGQIARTHGLAGLHQHALVVAAFA